MAQTVYASLEERDRRWLIIRRAMEQSGLQGLIIVSDGHVERRGSLRYVSDANSYVMFAYVVFPLEGEPIAINIRGGKWIKDTRALTLRAGWVPESEPYGEFIADAIKELNLDTAFWGIEGDFMPLAAYQRLVKELPRATFKQTNFIHELKLVKSPDELRLVENGVDMVDRACEQCFKIARPGKTWNEISSEVSKTLYHLGIEDIGGYPLPRQTSKIKPGDTYLLYPEIQAPGGYWIQFGRLISFGEPERESRYAWELSIEAQKRGAEKLRPGNTGADVVKAINDALKGTKYTGAPRGSGHAVGLDVLEKPFITLDDETVLKPGMVMTVHPILLPPPAFAGVTIADMYIITENESRKLSKIAPEIRVIK
jgi:Xaa-Pro aminopeptidase